MTTLTLYPHVRRIHSQQRNLQRSPQRLRPYPPTREPILITVIGPATGIDLVIKILHRLGFAEARAWSKLQNDPNTGRPMRVLTKWLRY